MERRHTIVIKGLRAMLGWLLIACIALGSTAAYAGDDADIAQSVFALPQRIAVFPLFAEEILLEMIGPGRIVYVGHTYFENGEAYSPTMELTRQIPGDFWQNTDEEALLALEPDLIILPNDLLDDYAIIFPQLSAADINVLFLSMPETIDDIADSLAIIGKAVGAQEQADAMILAMKAGLEAVADIVSGIPQDRRVRAVHYETMYGGEPGWECFYKANEFAMAAQAAGVINAGPDAADSIEMSNCLLASWNPDLITFDPVWHDTDGSVYEIKDGYIEYRIAAMLASPDLAGVAAIQNHNVHPLRLSLSQFFAQSVLELAHLAYPELFFKNME